MIPKPNSILKAQKIPAIQSEENDESGLTFQKNKGAASKLQNLYIKRTTVFNSNNSEKAPEKV